MYKIKDTYSLANLPIITTKIVNIQTADKNTKTFCSKIILQKNKIKETPELGV